MTLYCIEETNLLLYSILMTAIPRDASTVIVLKEAVSEGFEVFLLKRHEKSAFMGSNFVYPGGVVDKQDSDPEILSFCKGIPSEDSQKELLPFIIAGIRELFEESGMLLAYDMNGLPLNEAKNDSIHKYRNLLNKRKITLKEIVKKEGLFLALDQFHHLAHWITPEARPMRFNTHFFIARYPEGQKASADERETTEGAWMTPMKALEENLAATLVLSPPTLKTLEDISRFSNIEEVISFSKTSNKSPIVPLLISISNNWFLIFPWDPDYESLGKGEIPASPDHGNISTTTDNTTRILTRENCNIPYCRKK
jgi:8-oxo-dGTP pyrophosphatase MutT (NUDIX family)